MRAASSPRPRRFAFACALTLTLGCTGGNPTGPPLRVTVPRGAGLSTVADSLATRGIVPSEFAFKLYARLRGGAGSIRPGVYELRRGDGYAAILRKLVRGDVVRIRFTIPEGWTASQIAARLAQRTSARTDSVARLLTDTSAARRFGVPGPTLEGYLYPATYSFPLGTPLDAIMRALVDRYRQAWTPAMRARADSLGLNEREVVTLASIVEKEAKVWSERPRIAAVYLNRLRRGMRLQADPTVQYALGTHTARLTYRQIADVARNPYNTYTNPGLPPGPIASPSRGAIQAVLRPAADSALYFVARPNGTHVFTYTLAQHNAAKLAAKREAAAAGRR